MVTRTKPAVAAGLAVEIKPEPAKRGKKAAYPGFIEPCLATLRSRPPAGANWLHEIKFDGYRLQARIRPRQVKLLTRSGLDWTAKFGITLATALADLPVEEAVIDGEVVAEGIGVKKLSAEDARRVRFVRPELVAEVEFRSWTAEGLVRHASFRGLRDDKPANEVELEMARERRG